MRLTVALVALLAVTAVPVPALAQEETEAPGFIYDEVTLVPLDGSIMEWNGRRYTGSLAVRAVDNGLVLIETLSLDDYLLGIQEVPFSWEPDALQAQAVAARTYLAWTLSNGRAGAGATYGFDICATDQCQVYGGVGQVEGPEGDRWADAVENTAGEVLIYQGRPAQALYSSTSGGRTRNVEDVFGSRPVPYLQAVESPDELSPFVDWTVELSGPAFQRVLHDAGLAEGPLRDVQVDTTADGDGPWEVVIESDQGVARVSTWQFRRDMNRSGPDVLPDELPAERPDGRRYPQTILSPTYQIDREWIIGSDFTTGYVPATARYVITGNGWGHLVGMSQYGAQAMATDGEDYTDILAHFYGGLVPQNGDTVLPDAVEVGLVWGQPLLALSGDGPFQVLADGEVLADEVLGTWQLEPAGDDVVVVPPTGLGFPPSFRGVPEESRHEAGFVVRIQAELSSAAETRMAVFRGPRLVAVTDWAVREPGTVAFVWDATIDGVPAPPGPYRMVLMARSSDGRGTAITTAVIEG